MGQGEFAQKSLNIPQRYVTFSLPKGGEGILFLNFGSKGAWILTNIIILSDKERSVQLNLGTEEKSWIYYPPTTLAITAGATWNLIKNTPGYPNQE